MKKQPDTAKPPSHTSTPALSVLPSGVTPGPFLEWDVFAAAQAMCLKPDAIRFMLSYWRMVSTLVADYLDNHGFDREIDGPSNFLLKRNGKKYRLRVATTSLCLGPLRGSSSGSWQEKLQKELATLDGWIVVFLCDLPKGPTFIFDLEFAEVLLDKGLVDERLMGDQGGIWEFIHVHDSIA